MFFPMSRFSPTDFFQKIVMNGRRGDSNPWYQQLFFKFHEGKTSLESFFYPDQKGIH